MRARSKPQRQYARLLIAKRRYRLAPVLPVGVSTPPHPRNLHAVFAQSRAVIAGNNLSVQNFQWRSAGSHKQILRRSPRPRYLRWVGQAVRVAAAVIFLCHTEIVFIPLGRSRCPCLAQPIRNFCAAPLHLQPKMSFKARAAHSAPSSCAMAELSAREQTPSPPPTTPRRTEKSTPSAPQLAHSAHSTSPVAISTPVANHVPCAWPRLTGRISAQSTTAQTPPMQPGLDLTTLSSTMKCAKITPRAPFRPARCSTTKHGQASKPGSNLQTRFSTNKPHQPDNPCVPSSHPALRAVIPTVRSDEGSAVAFHPLCRYLTANGESISIPRPPQFNHPS